MAQVVKGKRSPADHSAATLVARDLDFHTWTRQQADLLRTGNFERLDALNIAEELLEVGNSEYDKLESNLRVVLLHMLKWDHQAERRSRSWALSIREHRRRIQRVLNKSPGLAPYVAEAMADAYQDSRDEAASETGLPLSRFPAAAPYEWRTVMEREFEIDPPDAM